MTKTFATQYEKLARSGEQDVLFRPAEGESAAYLDLIAADVRHEVARDIDELYEELSIRITP